MLRKGLGGVRVQAANIHLASYSLSYLYYVFYYILYIILYYIIIYYIFTFTWDITTPWNSLLQDIVENNHLSGSNSTTDDKKPLMVKYSGLAKPPSLDVSAVQAVKCKKDAEGKRSLCQCPVFLLQLLSKLGE